MSNREEVPKWYWDDLEWAREHSQALHERYHDVWVAIVNKQVVASSASIAQARRVAAKKTGRRPDDIPVEFIESGLTVYGQS